MSYAGVRPSWATHALSLQARTVSTQTEPQGEKRFDKKLLRWKSRRCIVLAGKIQKRKEPLDIFSCERKEDKRWRKSSTCHNCLIMLDINNNRAGTVHAKVFNTGTFVYLSVLDNLKILNNFDIQLKSTRPFRNSRFDQWLSSWQKSSKNGIMEPLIPKSLATVSKETCQQKRLS